MRSCDTNVSYYCLKCLMIHNSTERDYLNKLMKGHTENIKSDIHNTISKN